MVWTRFVYMLLLLTFCLIVEYKDQAVVVYTIAFLCTHYSHHVLLPKQLGWHTDWPKESLKDMKTIIFVLYLHTEFIWECCSQIQTIEDMLHLPKVWRFFAFLQLQAQKETVPKMVLQVIKDCTLPHQVAPGSISHEKSEACKWTIVRLL
jgi:hypothetical protein